MLLPARPLLIAVLAWLALAVVASIQTALLPAWGAAGGVLLLIAAVDAAHAWWETEPSAHRSIHATLPLGVPSPVTLTLRWNGMGARSGMAIDHAPGAFEVLDPVAHMRLEPGAATTIVYRARPLTRGEHRFGPLAVRFRSYAGLWWKQTRIPLDESVRVYPNFSVYSRHALQAANVAATRSGMLKRRRRGEGLDFEQLREYREGDTPRQIDWKATSRIGKLISREFQDERDQRILLLIDCGRRMGAKDGALSHFDHALDTLLLLAYVGLRHGDAVGMMTLGGPRRMLAPHKSPATLAQILHMVYDLQPTLEATDFEGAAEALLGREKKRALVVLLTNLRDEDDKSLLAAVQLLRRRHLVLVASLREKALDESCHGPGETSDAIALRDAAVDYRKRRDASFSRLRQQGVLCIDVAPGELATATVNRYLAIKAAGLL
jgi:uncharacterized protein (DUF58 family)